MVSGASPAGQGRKTGSGSRGLREARVVAGEEAREKGIRALPVRNPSEAQLGDQAVLEGAEPILDTPLRLGAVGGNPPDAEFLQRPPHLRGPRPARQLLGQGEGRALVAVEDAVPVAVDGQGEAVRARDALEEVKV